MATLRQEAFMEAFTAVDSHFREIFASLSDGDGKLQLDNPDDPLEGGLTLVAHPKGKAVRRLAAMSGGEIIDGAQLSVCPATLPSLSLLCP